MISIGLRVSSNKKIFYCLIERLPDDSINYLDISFVNIPKALLWPEALAYTRNTILDILNMYSVKNAVIRIAEFGTSFNNTIIERCYIEGVLQESIASSLVEKVLAGQISEFCPLLNIRREDFKRYTTAGLNYENIPENMNWNTLSLELREVILIANAGLNL